MEATVILENGLAVAGADAAAHCEGGEFGDSVRAEAVEEGTPAGTGRDHETCK